MDARPVARAQSLFFSSVPVPLSSHLWLLTNPSSRHFSVPRKPGTIKGWITFFRGPVFYCEDFKPSILWFSSDLGVETSKPGNHSHLVTSACTLYCPSALLVPNSEGRVSAPRLKDRKIPTHAFHCSIVLGPFFVLHLPVPNGRRPLIPMVLVVYFFRLAITSDKTSADRFFLMSLSLSPNCRRAALLAAGRSCSGNQCQVAENLDPLP